MFKTIPRNTNNSEQKKSQHKKTYKDILIIQQKKH